MKNSQFRIEQVHLESTANTQNTTTNTAASSTNTTTASTTANTTSETPTDTTAGGKDSTTTTTTDQPTDNKSTNKPIIVLMDKPNSANDKKEMTSPFEVVYFGVMGAIIIALLAVAYNSVKTANIAKVK